MGCNWQRLSRSCPLWLHPVQLAWKSGADPTGNRKAGRPMRDRPARGMERELRTSGVVVDGQALLPALQDVRIRGHGIAGHGAAAGVPAAVVLAGVADLARVGLIAEDRR